MSERYKQADIDAEHQAIELMTAAVRSTFTPAVLTDVGSVSGLFALKWQPRNPVLVASTEGVGTKVTLAAELGRWRGIGMDVVNRCVNDILVQGARPLFFLDYIASGNLVPEEVAAAVAGMAEACRAARCVLLGGKTAEMPGVYVDGTFDLAGTVVGIVGRKDILPRKDVMKERDLVVGLPSSGLHTNGFRLIRQLVAERDLLAPFDESGVALGDVLLAPHRCYLEDVSRLQNNGVPIKGVTHITGGGLVHNVPRVLPDGFVAEIQKSLWFTPSIFKKLLLWGNISEEEAYRVFNMGIGMVLIIERIYERAMYRLVPDAIVIGQLVASEEKEPVVRFVEELTRYEEEEE